jgi:hypothetical protein
MGFRKHNQAARRAEKTADAPDTMLPRRRSKRKYRRSLLREWINLMAITLLLVLLSSPIAFLPDRFTGKMPEWTLNSFILSTSIFTVGAMLVVSLAFLIWKYEAAQRRK